MVDPSWLEHCQEYLQGNAVLCAEVADGQDDDLHDVRGGEEPTLEQSGQASRPALVTFLDFAVPPGPPLEGLQAGQTPQNRILATLQAKLATMKGQHPLDAATYDPDFEKIAGIFLGEDPKLQTSKVAIGRIAEVEPEKVEPTLALLTNVLIYLEKLHHSNMEASLLDSPAELLMYVSTARWDETPMKVTHKHLLEVASHAPSELPGVGQAPRGADLPDAGQASEQLPYKASTVSKMLATELKYAMLIRCPLNTGQGLEDQYVALSGSHITWNQLLEHTNSPCMFQALQEGSQISQASNNFSFKARLCCTDQAGANARAERMVCDTLGDSWASLHLYCNMHHAPCVQVHEQMFQSDLQ